MNFNAEVMQYLANLITVKNNATSITQNSRTINKDNLNKLNQILSKIDNEFITVLLNESNVQPPWKVQQRDANTGVIGKPNALTNKDGTVVIGVTTDVTIEDDEPELSVEQMKEAVAKAKALIAKSGLEVPEEDYPALSDEDLAKVAEVENEKKQQRQEKATKAPAVKRAK